MEEDARKIRLERWRAERLWERAAELEAAEQEAQRQDLARNEAAISANADAQDSVELEAAVQAALESGMSPSAVGRSARLELALGALDESMPSRSELLSVRLCRIPPTPLSAQGSCPHAPQELLATFEALTESDQYGLRFMESHRIGADAELRVYELSANWGYDTKPFRDRLATYASINRLGIIAEPDGAGGTRFELLADTRRSARLYALSLLIIGASLGVGLGALGLLAMPLISVTLPLGLVAGGLGSIGLNRAIAAWAFPNAVKELKALARSLSIRTGGAPL